MSAPFPTHLKTDSGNLLIQWNDGHQSSLAFKDLRAACPCAGCKEEAEKPKNPFRILKANELAPLGIQKMEPVGRYAYRIGWADGHDTGIFTLEHLRELCRCEECLARKEN